MTTNIVPIRPPAPPPSDLADALMRRGSSLLDPPATGREARLLDVIRFYAEPGNWQPAPATLGEPDLSGNRTAADDRGRRARDALAQCGVAW